MALWLDKNDYEFETEDQKRDYILGTPPYRCTVCGEIYEDEDEALTCCHTDCYEQDKSFVEEEMADTRMRSEKGD